MKDLSPQEKKIIDAIAHQALVLHLPAEVYDAYTVWLLSTIREVRAERDKEILEALPEMQITTHVAPRHINEDKLIKFLTPITHD